MTPYIEFHPGGIPEIMKAAGKDGTQLFDEVWKNDCSHFFSQVPDPIDPR